MIKPGVLKALLDEHGVDYGQNSKSFILTCPRCRKKDKLYIRKSDGRFVCWVCKETEGFSGAPEWALVELMGVSIADLKQRLYGDSRTHTTLFIDLQLEDFFDENDEVPLFVPEDLPEVEPHPGFRELTSLYGDPGAAYLAGRGLSLELCLEYGIKYWPQEKSVVFPVLNQGRLLGWQTRRIDASDWVDGGDDPMVVARPPPKSVTSTGFKKERVLIFGHRITEEHAILCEGPVDAMKAHLCGGNICTWGKLVSKYQLQLLRNSGIKRLYLALDPDAFVEAGRVLREMVDDVEVYDMRPPQSLGEGVDIGAMSLEEVPQLMANAPRLNRNHIFIYLKDFYAA